MGEGLTMKARSYKIETPGKLLIAGEYAVTEPKQPGIVVAVNRYITVQIEESDHNSIDLPQLGLACVSWEYNNEQVRFAIDDHRLRFIHHALQVVYRYLAGQRTPVHLTVSSELDDTSGKKYGLGSSAAIVVAVITAMLKQQQGSESSKDVIFKLAAIAHFQTQGNGSCADIAASTYGGWLYYIAFDGDWLIDQLSQQVPICELTSMKWPMFCVEQIILPTDLQFCVGWTGEAAATAPMVDNIRRFKRKDTHAYQIFLDNSSSAVHDIVRGCKENNIPRILDGVARNRSVLCSISQLANVQIETPKLAKLAEIGTRYGQGKSSGAGGGDCGIAFVEGEEKALQLKQAWEDAGIKPLNLLPSSRGTNATCNCEQ